MQEKLFNKIHFRRFFTKENTVSLLALLFLLLPFIPILFPYGTYQESDLTINSIWCAGGLTIIYHALNNSLQLTPTVTTWLALSILSTLGIFQNSLCSITGVNDIREGTLTFISIASCIAFGKEHFEKIKFPIWVFPFAYGFITVFGFFGWRDLGWKTYNFLDVYGFAILASLPMYIAFRKNISSHKNIWDACFIAPFALLLFYCDNKALNLACLIGLFFIFAWPLLKNQWKIFSKLSDGFYVAAGTLVLSIFILLSWFFFDKLPLQLQSRTMLAIVTVLHFFDKFSISEFFHLIFGYGWGSYQQFPVLNIFLIDHFTVYSSGSYKPNWEFLERNLLHSHNITIETFISNGLIGVTLLIYGIYRIINSINPKDLVGKFYWISFLILYSAWFQMPTTIPFTIAAMVLVKEDFSFKIKLVKLPSIVFGVTMILFSLWDFYASYKTATLYHDNIKNFSKENSAFLKDPIHKYDQLNFGKCSNHVFSNATASLEKFNIDKDISLVPQLEQSVLEVVNDFLNSGQTQNIVSFVHVINMCNALVNLKKLPLHSLSLEFDQTFKKLVFELLQKFPGRADMAMGYLNWKFDILNDYDSAEQMADAVLKAYPNHSIGLAIKSLIGLSTGLDRPIHISNLRKAVKNGLNRFMPVPPEILKALEIQQ